MKTGELREWFNRLSWKGSDRSNTVREFESHTHLIMTNTDIQKDLLKNKTVATLDRFENGKLYYNIDILGDTYQFPVDTLMSKELTYINEHKEVHIVLDVPAVDVNGAAFSREMRGSELFRWIAKASNNGDLMKISQ